MKPQLMSSLSRLMTLLSSIGICMLIGAPTAMALDPSPPTYFITAPTGTRTDVAATNAQFLCLDILQGTPPSDITITSTKNPWVRKGRKVDPAKIPYVEGAVNWNNVPDAHPQFSTWVLDGQRHFKGNGIPNHPTGTFPVQANTPAYPYYAAAPAPPYGSAAEIPIAPYDLDVTVPANPVYSDTPNCINTLVEGVVTQTGAVWHANLAYAGVFVDPIAALPVDQCWGHPYATQYHYHGYSWKCFPNQGVTYQHSPLFGYAMDGFGVYGPRGDGGILLKNADLDECHGHFGRIKWDGQFRNMYHYHVNNEFPYGPGCYRGTPGTIVSNVQHASHGFPQNRGLPSVDIAPPIDSNGNVLH